MYQSFFNLCRRPFAATPDPGCVFLGGTIQTVVDELVVCLERGEGIAVLTAPAGLGKTLICEKVTQELGVGFVTALLRHADFRTPADLLRTLLMELGTPGTAADSEQELRLRVIGTLAELRRQSQLLAVICDEAHLLPEDVLEELRRLTDHADHGVTWARLLLAGQLELEEKLASSYLAALNQRLRSHTSLSPFTANESLDYIDYRITWAGGRTEEIFHPETLTAIVDAADGNPRCLNQLCDHVLLLAYVSERKPAPPELVDEALADLQQLPLTWNIRSQRSSTTSSFDDCSDHNHPEVSDAVEFGEHLTAWESTPTVSASSPEPSNDQSDVWEFGSDLASEAEPGAVGRSFDSSVELSSATSDAVQEVPVVDRYAAIDAGWPVDDLPPGDGKSLSPTTMTASDSRQQTNSQTDVKASEHRDWAVSEPEDQLHADVLELAALARGAVTARKFGETLPQMMPPEKQDSTWEAVETPTANIAPERPFRNLFTRLRRKQQGLE